ncbi:MAG: malate dehydrogenase (quinone) [Vicinamibacterales bacterium]
MPSNLELRTVDAVLVGGGVMSATVGALLKELEPGWSVEVFERLQDIALESSHVYNNAGTGHSAYCELNYTPQQADGSIDISKALKINEMFELSRQFWSYLVTEGHLSRPRDFISSVPHISFVRGEEDVAFLRKRFEALCCHPLFDGMEYTEDRGQMAEWMPLVMEGRPAGGRVAATRARAGTDVNFGALTHGLFRAMSHKSSVRVHLQHDVKDLTRLGDGSWRVTVKDTATGETKHIAARFVFLGAGGRALPLLLNSGIPEARGYGGFPVSGEWLVCLNPAVIERHHAKVYGKAEIGAPPMSVPHLDTRVVDGEKTLLFGPYAGFSTKFLKLGSYFDLPYSIRLHNIVPLLMSAVHNLSLVRYLVREVLQSSERRLQTLREYYPEARAEDWELRVAGQRVQVIHQDPKTGTYLQFGTEVVNSAEGTLSALLGASPGASTSVAIVLELLARCFPHRFATEAWQTRLRKMIPTFGMSLPADREMCCRIRQHTREVLELTA